MRILVTGSNGLLGQKLLHTLPTDIHDLYGIDLQESSFIAGVPHYYERMDITDRKAVQAVITRLNPHLIVHTAATTDVDGCELNKELCWKVNVSGTDNLAVAASRVKARFIFISSDYVFDGTKGPYKEDDPPTPVSYYGRSKLAGENLLRSVALEWTIVRTIVLYGVGVNVKSSFITWLLGMLRAGRPVRIVNDQWGNTTIVDDLAAGIERIIMLDRQGIYHIGGRGYMSRYEFAVRAAQLFNLDPALVIPIATGELRQPAKRPLRSGLEIDKAERDLFIAFRDTTESLLLYKEQESTITAA